MFRGKTDEGFENPADRIIFTVLYVTIWYMNRFGIEMMERRSFPMAKRDT